MFLKTFKKQFLSTFNKKRELKCYCNIQLLEFQQVQQTTKHWGNLTFCTKWKHETGLVFCHLWCSKAHYSTRLLYEPQMHCTKKKKQNKTLSFFSVQKSVLIAIICKIIYFMKSYHDKQYEKCFKHENNENNLRKEHSQQ